MKIYARLYAMNFGIAYILRSLRCGMELHLITGTAAKKLLMLNVRTGEEFVFMERF